MESEISETYLSIPLDVNEQCLSLLLSVEAADKCGDGCRSTQVCGNSGTCLEKSNLVECGPWHSTYYCQKGIDCCGYNGCMPAGAVCCGQFFYCPSGRACCGSKCCEAGHFCDNGECVLDMYSTKKPLTTRSVETTAPPFTRYPTMETTRWFNPYTTGKSYKTDRSSSTSQFQWWYGVIIGAVVVTGAVIIAAVIWHRRNSRSNAPGLSGTGGMVLSAPPQIYGTVTGGMVLNAPRNIHGTGTGGLVLNAPPQVHRTGTGGMVLSAPSQIHGTSTGGIVLRAPVQTNGKSPSQNMYTVGQHIGVPMHTNGRPLTQNVAYVVTKTGVPLQTNG